jgi:4-hydroxybutyryl-CoA dehydratase/vinylacetyl-CoA-Delta-isomerase
MKAVARAYELALRPEFEAIMTARSHLTGKKVNRFTHIRTYNNIDEKRDTNYL